MKIQPNQSGSGITRIFYSPQNKQGQAERRAVRRQRRAVPRIDGKPQRSWLAQVCRWLCKKMGFAC